MKTKSKYQFLMTSLVLVPTVHKELGIPMVCIKKTGAGIKPGEMGVCHDPEWFNIKGKYWQPHHLVITSDEALKKGDYCLFYGQISKVLEINGTSVKIETLTQVSKEDAKLINNIKGKKVAVVGSFSTMIHSFSMKQLPKIIASTSKEMTPKSWIKMKFVQAYAECYNKKERVSEVMIKAKDGKIVSNNDGSIYLPII